MAKKPEPPQELTAWSICKISAQGHGYATWRAANPARASSALAKKAVPAPCAGYQGAGILRTGPGEGQHARSAVQEAGRRLWRRRELRAAVPTAPVRASQCGQLAGTPPLRPALALLRGVCAYRPMRSRCLSPRSFGRGRGSFSPLAQLPLCRSTIPMGVTGHSRVSQWLSRGIGGSVWGGRRAPSGGVAWRASSRRHR